MRRLGGLVAMLMTLALAGCGGRFPLPTELRTNRPIPSDKSYEMLATWTGMTGISDILLTQGQGSQLFLLFNTGGSGLAPRGTVGLYSRTSKTGTPTPFLPPAFTPLVSLFNPITLCAGTLPGGSPSRRLFVLDQGDTAIARANPATGFPDTTQGWTLKISNLAAYWRVREFSLLGGDTMSTFTDTTVAFVTGAAADDQGLVYVAGISIARLPNPFDARLFERVYRPVIWRYARGPRYPGVTPYDHNMPGALWHRDTSWTVEGNPGVGTIGNVAQIDWGAAGSWIYTCDPTGGLLQQLSIYASNSRGFIVDGSDQSPSFSGPLDVTSDLQGFVYIADTGNQRVQRRDSGGNFIQRVDIEKDAFGQTLRRPVTLAADDSLVFIGDVNLAEVIRYRRRP